jgi:hypothetical protein
MVVDVRPGAPKLSRTSSGGCRFCAIVVTQFVTHFDATSAPIRVSGKRWSSDPRSGLLGARVDRFRVRAESALSTGRNLLGSYVRDVRGEAQRCRNMGRGASEAL